MLNIDHVRVLVVRPALKHIALHSQSAEDLVLGTLVQESRLTYLQQVGGGPGLGVAQMEPETFNWLWDDYLHKRPELKARVRSLMGDWREGWDMPLELVSNLAFASAMCRVRYLPVSAPLPDEGDLAGLGAYWKKYYNTAAGAGTAEQWIGNYNKYVLRRPA